MPVDPSTATQFDEDLLARTRAALPKLGELTASWDEMIGFPLWDFIGVAVWLDPTIVTAKETLYVDYSTQFGPNYGDTLSWREKYNPGLGEQPADVVFSVDPKRMNDLIVESVRMK